MESVQLARRRGGIEYVLLLRLVDHAHDRGVREQEEVGEYHGRFVHRESRGCAFELRNRIEFREREFRVQAVR